MTSFHLQSFLFAGVLLVSVFITRPSASLELAALTPQESLARTSVAIAPASSSEGAPPPAVSRATAAENTLLPEAPSADVPRLSAHTVILKNLTSGQLFLEKNPNDRWPIASLVKLMTAIVASEEMDMAKKITMTEHAVAREGAIGNFAPGEVFTVRDLVAATLVGSSNDAAEALAESYGTDAFILAMQKKASTLGMTHTTFFDATGLSYLNQSIAADLEILARDILTTHPELLAVTHTGAVQIREERSGELHTIRSTHPFAQNPDFIGGKTGFIPEARGNLISFFRHTNDVFLVIVLGSDDRLHETQILYDFIARR